MKKQEKKLKLKKLDTIPIINKYLKKNSNCLKKN